MVATGFKYQDLYLTFQEYFEKLGQNPNRWGKPAAALLGALMAQVNLGLAAVGGKDSMSGTFENLDVPPTLVSFATGLTKGDNIRPKEISLGYTFDKDFLRETRIRQLSLKLQATNVALLYADKRLNGDDPDYLANGYTPISPKRLIFTLRVGL